jgi:hypothetical protein
MKYLKSFESLSFPSDTDKLREYSRNYLAYLMDAGFNIQVTSLTQINDNNTNKVNIIINKSGYGNFKWNEVKDYLIPFLTMLNQDYKIDSYPMDLYHADIHITSAESCTVKLSNVNRYNINDIIDEVVKPDDNKLIYRIFIRVNDLR